MSTADYDRGWCDAFMEFNRAMNEFTENMKGDQALARVVMKERLMAAVALHTPPRETGK